MGLRGLVDSAEYMHAQKQSALQEELRDIQRMQLQQQFITNELLAEVLVELRKQD